MNKSVEEQQREKNRGYIFDMNYVYLLFIGVSYIHTIITIQRRTEGLSSGIHQILQRMGICVTE